MSQYSSTPAHISEDDGVSYDTQRNPPVVQRFDAVTNYPLTAPPSSDFHPNTFDFWNELDFDAQASSSVDPAWLDNISCSGNKELAMLMPDEFDKDIEALANFDHAFKSAAVPPSLGDDFYNFGSHGAFQLVGNSIQYADQLQSDMRSSTAPSTSAASASTSISNSSFGSDWLSLCDPYQISDDGGASEYLESHYGSVPGPSPFPSGGGPVNQESESFGEEKLSGSTSLHAFELDSALRVPALDNTAAAGTLGTQQDEPEKGWACPECPQRCKRKSNMVAHMVTHLPKEERSRYACIHPGCFRSYSRKHDLRRHANDAHVDVVSTSEVDSRYHPYSRGGTRNLKKAASTRT